MDKNLAKDIMEAGTGFGVALPETIRQLNSCGYTENLSARFDHFEAQSGEIKMYPHDLIIDEVRRFENSSDPDDQAILFALRDRQGRKGIYVDSFGLYHDDLSPELNRKMTEARRDLIARTI